MSKKQALEHFKDIEELELAGEPLGVTVRYMFPYKCEQVEQALLKAQEQEKVLEKELKLLEILLKYVYYSDKSRCIRMREIRKSTKNFDYEELKELLNNDR